MSKTNYQQKERNRRVTTCESFIASKEHGVPIQTASREISKAPGMEGVSKEKVREYLFDLLEAGKLFLDSEACLKVTPEVSDNVKEWLKNGDRATE